LQMKESIKANQAELDRLGRENSEGTRTRDDKLKADILELRTMVARMSTRIDEMAGEIAKARGAAEENEYAARRATEPVAARIAPLEKRLDEIAALNREMASRIDALQKQALEKAGEHKTWKNDEEAYEDALESYRKGSYEESIEKFENVSKLFPASRLVGNCIYWQGESNFALKQYSEAIDRFGIVIEKHPENPKVPAAYLKAAIAFIEMKKTSEARIFLQKLLEKHPSSEQADAARARLKTLK
ncbi:MAG: tol-pal system protein YbgF, partial [Candidatus Omnitrophica bacterium]|nr:tol-pal system protein YbgF [Candidatus Omnitrophota bacterium]